MPRRQIEYFAIIESNVYPWRSESEMAEARLPGRNTTFHIKALIDDDIGEMPKRRAYALRHCLHDNRNMTKIFNREYRKAK